MRIVMTMVVRDERDVIEQNLRLHRALGVDAFAILDNGSTDGTGEVLARWRDAGIAEVCRDDDAAPGEVFRDWPTRLARLAAQELGADWVIHDDADELWWPLAGNLRDAFGSLPPDAQAVLAPRFEFVPRPGDGPWWQRLTVRERDARVRPKVAHRAAEDVEVGPGSHSASSAGIGLEPTAGRPSLRGLRRRLPEPRLIAPAPSFPIAIWHVPLRSEEQHRHRLEIGARLAGSTARPAFAKRMSDALTGEGDRWAEVVVDDAQLAAGIAAGRLVEETGLREVIESLAGMSPAEIEPGSARVPDRTEEELAELRADVARAAVAGLVHNEAHAVARAEVARRALGRTRRRLQGTRRRLERRRKSAAATRGRLADAQRRLRRTRRDLDRSRRRLRRLQGHLWWRLRPRRPWRRRPPQRD